MGGDKVDVVMLIPPGAELFVLNPIESLTEQEMKNGKNYLTIMGENLVNLPKALK